MISKFLAKKSKRNMQTVKRELPHIRFWSPKPACFYYKDHSDKNANERKKMYIYIKKQFFFRRIIKTLVKATWIFHWRFWWELKPSLSVQIRIGSCPTHDLNGRQQDVRDFVSTLQDISRMKLKSCYFEQHCWSISWYIIIKKQVSYLFKST